MLVKKLLNISILLTYILFLIGATVRAYGAGLACPDWPKCHGVWIPLFDFQIFLEWFHRLIASFVGFLMLGIWFWTLFAKHYRAQVKLATLSLIILLAQAFMGAYTVFELNSPESVMMHLGIGFIFLACLLLMRMRLAKYDFVSQVSSGKLKLLFALCLVVVFCQAMLGAWLAASHGGLACPDFPTCFGTWFPHMQGLVSLQMFHRFGAYLVVVVLALLLLKASREQISDRLRTFLLLTCLALCVQFLLGATNVWFELPQFLRIAHSGGASLLFVLLVMGNYEYRRSSIS